MITFDDVVKVYPGGGTAVDHLSLELPTGKLTVLVGPSGCGKTTSLRMINKMVSPTSGRVLIDGKDVSGQDEAVLRRGIGYVIQHAGLFPHRTVLDNVATVPMLLGRTRRQARAAALELLERVALTADFAGRYLAQFGTPQDLLEQPVDDFVAEFVGRDRGLRSLSFDTAAELPVRPLTDAAADGAELVLDAAGRPAGWRRAAGTEPTADTGGAFTQADSLRLVTDLAIMSPVGIAVRVDAEGKADGIVRHHDLVDYLAARRDHRAAERAS